MRYRISSFILACAVAVSAIDHFQSQPIFAQDNPTVAATQDDVGKPVDKDEARKQYDRRMVAYYSGLMALIGIVVTGVGIAALIRIWGGNIRRRLRLQNPNPENPERDFWFLKPPKPTVTDSGLPEVNRSPNDRQSNKDDDSRERE